MPPKQQITRETIIKAGFELVRSSGAEALNVRKVALKLNCSTQPIMYQFASVNELKDEIYAEADRFHTEYIMDIDSDSEDPMLAIGLRYIKFAAEEKYLFRFLFQSDKYASRGFDELIGGDELTPIFSILHEQAEITEQQSRDVFAALFLAVHGISGLLANNSMDYDEEYFKKILNNVFMGVIGMMRRENI